MQNLKSHRLEEASGRGVAEIGWSHHAQTFVVHPPVLAGTATLKFQLKPVGIMHAPYVGFIVNADDYGDVLGNGKTCARLGVEVPVSWGFAVTNSSICTSFERDDLDDWSLNHSAFNARGFAQFWSKETSRYHSKEKDIELTADVDSGRLKMTVGDVTVVHSMPAGTSVRFAISLRCRSSGA